VLARLTHRLKADAESGEVLLKVLVPLLEEELFGVAVVDGDDLLRRDSARELRDLKLGRLGGP
jgi:hypothetical protein